MWIFDAFYNPQSSLVDSVSVLGMFVAKSCLEVAIVKVIYRACSEDQNDVHKLTLVRIKNIQS